MAVKRCAPSPVFNEYSLCGLAFDAFDSKDIDEPFQIIEDGGSITCPSCCAAIRAIKAMRNKLTPRAEYED